MCRRVKKKILDVVTGGFKIEYALLYSYAEELKLSNHGFIVEIKPCTGEDGKPKFKYMYICVTACKAGWKARYRLVLYMDGCFLKGLCKGQLSYIIDKDGNNQIFPMAWVVVDLETKKS